MRLSGRTASLLVTVFLLAPPVLVYCLAPPSPVRAQAAKQKGSSAKKQQPAGAATPEVRYGTDTLPDPVVEMREAIMAAVRSGRIEDLRHAYELNELKPEIASQPVSDPVGYWKQISGDGEGREVLAALAEILDAAYAVLPLGADLENNRIYVWPYFAEVPPSKLTPGQEVELLRLVAPEEVKKMRTKDKYTHWRLAIGADGTWHYLRKGE